MLVKVVVVGDKSVGKSSLIKSFINTNENDVFSVEDVNHTTNVRIKHTQFVIQFSEKAGWEKEEQEPKQPDLKNGFNLYRYNTKNEINAQVIVYDVTNEQSFDFINKWIYGNRTDAPTILIANQCDIFPNNIDGKEKILSYGYCRDYAMHQIILMCAKYYGQKKTGKQYAKQNNMIYFEVSTMHNDINAAFKCISELALVHKELSNYRANYDMYQERMGSFNPTIWKPGYGKIMGRMAGGGMYPMSGMTGGEMYPMNGMPMSQMHGMNMMARTNQLMGAYQMNSAANNIHEQEKQYFKHIEEQRVQFEKRYSSMSSAIPPVIPTPPKQTIEINENSNNASYGGNHSSSSSVKQLINDEQVVPPQNKNNSWRPFVLFFGIVLYCIIINY